MSTKQPTLLLPLKGMCTHMQVDLEYDTMETIGVHMSFYFYFVVIL